MSADDFIAGAAQAAATADWIGVNCHWTDGASMRAAETAYEEYRARFPSKLLMITEFSNPTADDGEMEKAQQYLDFYRGLRNKPGIGAAFAFTISAENGHNSVAWRNGSDSMGKIPEIIGSRSF